LCFEDESASEQYPLRCITAWTVVPWPQRGQPSTTPVFLRPDHPHRPHRCLLHSLHLALTPRPTFPDRPSARISPVNGFFGAYGEPLPRSEAPVPPSS